MIFIYSFPVINSYIHSYFICVSQIRREDVDFHHYYGDDELLEDLKQRMDQKLYPPRCKARVVTNKDFFAKSRSIIFQVLCNAKCTYRGKITIPSHKNGMNK